MIPTSITLPPKDYDELLSIIKWDQSMPSVMNHYLGDRYGEWMWEAKRQYIPGDLEDWEYISHIELHDTDKIIVVFGEDRVDDKQEWITDNALVPVFRGE